LGDEKTSRRLPLPSKDLELFLEKWKTARPVLGRNHVLNNGTYVKPVTHTVFEEKRYEPVLLSATAHGQVLSADS
jgi:hypothetical protein